MGRTRGVPNKITREVKEMVLEALEHAGGAEYLYMQAFNNPKAFLSLVGRIVPLQVDANVDLRVTLSERLQRARERVKGGK
jgi:hypothetical protein